MRTRLMSAALAASALLLLAGCSAGAPDGAAPDAGSSTTSTAAAAGDCAYPASGQPAVDVTPPAPGTERPTGSVPVTLDTSAGEISMTLTGDRTPCTVESFVSLAQQQYFTNTSCHRLTTQGIFVLQCGDPTGSGRGGPGYTFADEVDGSETYPAGTVAMANTGRPGTNGSQFFLVYADSTLPPSYTVFGTLTPDGLATVQKIAEAGVSGGGADGTPATPVEITDVVVG